MLILEGAQAGLSWSTILGKRDNYRRAFAGFDAALVASYDDATVATLLTDPGIVRNRLKVRGALPMPARSCPSEKNSGLFPTTFGNGSTDHQSSTIPASTADLPARTELSDRIAKDLNRRGFTFVVRRSVQLFASGGVVDDHVVTCPAKRAG